MSGHREAVLYTRRDCPLCHVLARLAGRSARRHRVGLREIDVDGDAALRASYGDRVPVLEIPGEAPIAAGSAARDVDAAFGRAAVRLGNEGGAA